MKANPCDAQPAPETRVEDLHMSRKVVVINGHPDPSPERLCHAIATAYEDGAQAADHSVRRIDIAALNVPMLRTAEEFTSGKPVADIVAAQEALRWADQIVIVYPLWLGTMPALLKAFLEQTFRPGFAFSNGDDAWPKKGLTGKTARVIVTMGMPAMVYRFFYLSHSLRSLERNILKFCGISPVRETLFGMVEAAGEAKVKTWLASVRGLGREAR